MKFEGEQTSDDAPTSPEGYDDTFTDLCVINKDEFLDGGLIKSFTTSQV